MTLGHRARRVRGLPAPGPGGHGAEGSPHDRTPWRGMGRQVRKAPAIAMLPDTWPTSRWGSASNAAGYRSGAVRRAARFRACSRASGGARSQPLRRYRESWPLDGSVWSVTFWAAWWSSDSSPFSGWDCPRSTTTIPAARPVSSREPYRGRRGHHRRPSGGCRAGRHPYKTVRERRNRSVRHRQRAVRDRAPSRTRARWRAPPPRFARRSPRTRGYQVTGGPKPRSAHVAGSPGGRACTPRPGREGRYAVFLADGIAVEVTVAGNGIDLRRGTARRRGERPHDPVPEPADSEPRDPGTPANAGRSASSAPVQPDTGRYPGAPVARSLPAFWMLVALLVDRRLADRAGSRRAPSRSTRSPRWSPPCCSSCTPSRS